MHIAQKKAKPRTEKNSLEEADRVTTRKLHSVQNVDKENSTSTLA
jgi:hypothetical protein